MSLFDLLVLFLLFLSAAIGWARGGVKEVITLLAIGGGFAAFALLGPQLAASGSLIVQAIILLLVFLGGFAVVSLAGTIVAGRTTKQIPHQIDQAMGSIFGALRGWILAAFVLFTVELYHIDAPKPPMIESSLFAPALHVTASTLGADTP